MIVYLHLSHYTCDEVFVDFSVTGITATAGDDYELQASNAEQRVIINGNGGTVHFYPGQIDTWFTINTKIDNLPEPDETLRVDFSNPSNATLSTASVTAIIRGEHTYHHLSYFIEGDADGGIKGDGSLFVSKKGQKKGISPNSSQCEAAGGVQASLHAGPPLATMALAAASEWMRS